MSLALRTTTNQALRATLSHRSYGMSQRVKPFPFFPLGMRLFYGHSMFPNGVIRFETKKNTYGAFNFTGEMLIVSGVLAMFAAHALLLNDHKRFPKLGERPASNLMYHHLNVYGISPDLDDQSYGSWNYYPEVGNPKPGL